MNIVQELEKAYINTTETTRNHIETATYSLEFG